jgi:PAS domain S-box-containing protein
MVSGLALFVGLFNNLALFIIFVAVYGFLTGRLGNASPIKRQFALGLASGLFALGCMQVKIPVTEGVLVDQRNAIVILGGAFGGPLTGVMTALTAAVYRVILGGRGVLGGTLGICLSAVAGIAFFYNRRRIDNLWKAGLCTVAAAVFILPGFLPIGTWREGWALMKAMAFPYGSAISVGIFVGSLLLVNEERRCKAQAELRESESRYRNLFESLVDVGFQTDADDVIVIVSPSSEQAFGYHPDEMVGKRMAGFYEDPERRAELVARIKREGFVRNFETTMVRKDGSPVVVSTNARALGALPGAFTGVEDVARDVIQIKRAEERIKSSLKEKEALLMELYHRTNNNMQIISSFLLLQAAASPDDKVNALVENVTSRIYAMSLVYEKLYRSDNLSRINIREYVEDLIALIMSYGNLPEGKVRIELDVEDVYFVIDTAIPLGLVINELVANSCKHAFPGDRKGVIRISLRRESADTITLTVSDDGTGMPRDVARDAKARFGIETTLSIIRLQMNGTVEVSTEGGVSYRITLKDNLYRERI